ncbi:MAG: hypothetical protein ACR2N8_03625 [Parvibaculales bacterium]
MDKISIIETTIFNIITVIGISIMVSVALLLFGMCFYLTFNDIKMVIERNKKEIYDEEESLRLP